MLSHKRPFMIVKVQPYKPIKSIINKLFSEKTPKQRHYFEWKAIMGGRTGNWIYKVALSAHFLVSDGEPWFPIGTESN